jgi:hypothetical protein
MQRLRPNNDLKIRNFLDIEKIRSRSKYDKGPKPLLTAS